MRQDQAERRAEELSKGERGHYPVDQYVWNIDGNFIVQDFPSSASSRACVVARYHRGERFEVADNQPE